MEAAVGGSAPGRRWIVWLVVGLVVVLLVGTGVYVALNARRLITNAALAVGGFDGTTLDAARGYSITSVEAQSREARLQESPGDIHARAELVGYYLHAEYQDPRGTGRSARTKRINHVLWFISHRPDLEVLRGPDGAVERYLDPSGFQQLSTAWRATLARAPHDTAALLNAASFYDLSGDKSTAASLFQRAETANPQDPKVADRVGHFYLLQADSTSDESQRAALARIALAKFETAYRFDDQTAKSYELPTLAKTAFVAGSFDKAAKYAHLALVAYPGGSFDWNSGNAVHDGHMVLGQIAVHDGNLEVAERELLAAGRSSGSPQLDSFGPNMSLARDLLQAGRREAVLSYFDEVARFWKSGGRLDSWRAEVRVGDMPDFGANLDY